MRTIGLVIVNEIITKLTQRSFLFAAFGIPLLASLIFSAVAAVGNAAPGALDTVVGGPQTVEREGYVDAAHVIKAIPIPLDPDSLRAYPDEAAARAALAGGEIAAFYLIPADYLALGEVLYLRAGFNPLADGARTEAMQWTLFVNVLDGDVDLAARVSRPLILEEISLAPEPQRDDDNPLTFFLPYAIMLVFYSTIFGTASHNISSLTTEKENNTIELLLTSMTPRQMFTGKIVGLGVVGLFQALAWIGTSYVLARLTGQALSVPPEFELPPSIIAWGIIFFVLGYALYAGLMAGLGAVVPNLREASQAAFLIGSPLFVALMFVSVLVADPHGAIATGLSLFPMTAPVVMMTRLAAGGEVPLWQVGLAIALLLISIVLEIRAVSGIFRAQALLSGQPFRLRTFFLALAGRGGAG